MPIDNITQETTNVSVAQATNTNVTVTTPAPVNLTLATSGLQGAVGPSSSLAVGTTTTGAPGTDALLAITGTAPNQIIDFTIPRGNTGATGDVGPIGPAPTLSSVIATTGLPGTAAAGSLSGTNPYTINLTIPRGAVTLTGTAAPATGTGGIGDWYLNTTNWDMYEKTATSVWTLRGNIKGATGSTGAQGATGPANQLVLGTVTASAPGSSPAISITGAAPSQTISFTLPRGDTGPTGPAPSLTIGTTTTGAAGSSATASIGGTNPNYSLSLSIPQGLKGDVGSEWFNGTGAPSTSLGVVGDYYLIDSGTSGVGSVYKKTGAATWTLQGNIRGQAGTGNVDSVNSILPDGAGNVVLTWNDFTGTIPASALPSMATTETYTIASQAAMLALTAQRGDLAIRTDLDETYILAGTDPTVLANWTQLLTDGGTVRLTGDQTIGGIKTFSSSPVVPDSSFTIAKTTGLQTALNAKENTLAAGTTAQYYRGDKSWQTLNSTAVGLANVANLAQVDLVNAQTVAGIKTFSASPIVPDPTTSTQVANKSYVDTGLAGKANTSHVHDAGAITTGTFVIARIPTGTTSTTVALGNHLHAGVYEPVIAAGTTAQYRRGDNSWQTLNVAAVSGAAPLASPTFTGTVAGITATMVGLANVANLAQVDLVNAQTIAGIKTFSSPIVGSGASLTALNGSNISTGTVAQARIVQNTQRIIFTTAGTARPTGSTYVEWVGPVSPTNAVDGDTWVNTA